MKHDTLLGHLTYFGAFSGQGELLCTQGLGYLLREPRASELFVRWLGQVAPGWSANALDWHAELVQSDGARPDLEGRDGDGRARVKVEAKLGAPLTDAQVRAYADGLSEEGLVVLLVPRARKGEVTVVARVALPEVGTASETGAWRSESGPLVVVVAWQEVFDALREAALWPKGGDLDQLEGLYLGLATQHVEPLAGLSDLRAWEPRAKDLRGLVDKVTRKLQAELRAEPKAMPFGTDPVSGEPETAVHRGYLRRYVCVGVCFSVGVRHPFRGRRSPLWLRVHAATPDFEQIRNRLRSSSLASKLVESDGHVWLELDVRLDASGDETVEAIAVQCRAAWALIAPSGARAS